MHRAKSLRMRAMILAAGLGTRLRPLTDSLPKPLVEVAGKPLIDYALETVARAGITEVVVNLHYLGHLLREYLGDGSRFGLNIAFSEEDPIQDSGGGIRDARHLLGDETFVTLNSDTIVQIDLKAMLAYHREKAALATLALRKDPDQSAFGIIATQTDGRIGAFLEHRRPGLQEPLEPYMYTGVQILEPGVFAYLDEAGPLSITRRTYPRMLAADEALFGWPFSGRWVTVGTPEELAKAPALLAGADG